MNRVRRLQPAFRHHGWTIVVISSRLGIWFACKRAGVPCILAARTDRQTALTFPTQSRTDTSGLAQPGPDFDAFLANMWAALSTVTARFPLQALALWGINPADEVIRMFGKKHGLPVLHFEIGNVEPKTFFDFEGVNAQSRVAREPELLDAYDATEQEIEEWRTQFVRRKREQQRIPQQGQAAAMNPWFIVDLLGAVVLRIPQPSPLSLTARLSQKWTAWRRRFQEKPPAVMPAGPFIFLPLQVSTDANLRLFSNTDNLQAIAVAADRAARQQCPLVIKPHPAETDASLMGEVRGLCRRNGYVLTSANTAKLILGAVEVVTINSTVGLEARLMGKPVITLGRSLYERFSDRQAAVYAMRHLLPFFPFGKDSASPEVASRLIAAVEAEKVRMTERALSSRKAVDAIVRP